MYELAIKRDFIYMYYDEETMLLTMTSFFSY